MSASIIALVIAFFVVPPFCPAAWLQIQPRRKKAMRLALQNLRSTSDRPGIPVANPGLWDGRILLDDGSQIFVQLQYGFSTPRRRAWFRVTDENHVERLTAAECELFGIEIPIWV
jgi:hypothetical protein